MFATETFTAKTTARAALRCVNSSTDVTVVAKDGSHMTLLGGTILDNGMIALEFANPELDVFTVASDRPVSIIVRVSADSQRRAANMAEVIRREAGI